MSMPLEEHGYRGFTEVSSAELASEKTKTSQLSEKNASKGLNFKATELRLGLPGSESPERVKVNDGYVGNDDFSGVNHAVKHMVSGAKRGFSVAINGASSNWVLLNTTASEVAADNKMQSSPVSVQRTAPPASSKAQVVGWPPIRSFRKNSMAITAPKTEGSQDCKLESECHYIKVSMDGAPYLRKIDLKTYGSYVGLSSALEKMFSGFTMGQSGNKGLPCLDESSEGRLINKLQRSEYVLTYEDKDGDWMLVGDVPWKMFIDTCRRLRIMKSSDAVGLASRSSDD
ncbi:auxin-responsive protein IAA27-like [Silene latifolia]|uniref:auxin-responsive protein IAA27-like n=1 Tax=Silene latifolia TaxID=37657 RepID=UPI003D77B27A